MISKVDVLYWNKSDILTGAKHGMTENPQYLALVQKKQNFHS